MAGGKGTSSSTEQNDATSGFESAYSWLRCHYYGGKDAVGSGGGNDPTAKGKGKDVERGGSNNIELNDALLDVAAIIHGCDGALRHSDRNEWLAKFAYDLILHVPHVCHDRKSEPTV